LHTVTPAPACPQPPRGRPRPLVIPATFAAQAPPCFGGQGAGAHAGGVASRRREMRRCATSARGRARRRACSAGVGAAWPQRGRGKATSATLARGVGPPFAPPARARGTSVWDRASAGARRAGQARKGRPRARTSLIYSIYFDTMTFDYLPTLAWVGIFLQELLGTRRPWYISSRRPLASGRRSRPRTLAVPVPRQMGHTRVPRPKHCGHSVNS